MDFGTRDSGTRDRRVTPLAFVCCFPIPVDDVDNCRGADC